MGNDKKTYLIDGEAIDVNIDDVNDFIKEFPNAKEAKSFIVGKDTFDVDLKDLVEFQKEYPNAKPLYAEVEKKKFYWQRCVNWWQSWGFRNPFYWKQSIFTESLVS